MLQRFEELVFHNGERVFLPLPELAEGFSWRPGGDASFSDVSGSNPASPPPRRFHTVHDAAAWIEHNWPDFDLDATMPVTSLGEL